jgi:hypothetical protein
MPANAGIAARAASRARATILGCFFMKKILLRAGG